MVDDYDPNDPNDRDGTGEGFASEPIEHGPPPMGDEPQIGQSFVWMKAEAGKWGELIESITDVIGPGGMAGEFLVAYRDGHTMIHREGNRWVRAH